MTDFYEDDDSPEASPTHSGDCIHDGVECEAWRCPCRCGACIDGDVEVEE